MLSRSAFRARAFAPVMSGPEWQPLMRAVYRRLCAEARERGYAVLVIREGASRSPLALALVLTLASTSPTPAPQHR